MRRVAVWWVRQDLRLADNPALGAAIREGAVLPVFVLDEASAEPWAPGAAQRWWLHHSLAALGDSLRAAGAPLVLRHGATAEVLAGLAAAAGAATVHAAAAHEPWARRQEQAVARALGPARLVLHRGRALHDPAALATRAGNGFGVYTPFRRALLESLAPAPPAPAPTRIPAAPAPEGLPLAALALRPRPDWAAGLRAAWQPGEAGARARLHAFLRGPAARYPTARDQPAEDATSGLSPHLQAGEMSPATLWHAVEEAGLPAASRAAFLGEVIWREFAIHLLWHHERLPEAPLRPGFAAMPWRKDAAALRAWQEGRTGVPLVDAGMRQLWQTGWMHNRVRMVAASFLVKHLLLPWQAGARWFWDTLVDADLANNSASWQWVAGSGADAAPFFRVFNPVLQGRKFDPDGAYVRRFVPELRHLPAAAIHAPWMAGGAPGYPAPIVDLAAGRARALAAFGAARAGLRPVR